MAKMFYHNRKITAFLLDVFKFKKTEMQEPFSFSNTLRESAFPGEYFGSGKFFTSLDK